MRHPETRAPDTEPVPESVTVVDFACRLFAVFASGAGGLAIEQGALRRHLLVSGATSTASALVLGAFLGGIGLGGLWIARARPRWPLATAATLYGAVAALAVAGDVLLAGSADAGGGVVGTVLLLLHPALAAVAMGAAFPLVFSGVSPVAAGALVGMNLLGSVVTAAWAGLYAIPLLGLARTSWFAAGCYAAGAVALAFLGRAVRAGSATETARGGARRPTPARPAVSLLAVAALTGFVTLGHEFLLLRRLVYYLEGFQPTLSATLAVALVSLAVGGWLASLLMRVGGATPRVFAGIACLLAAGASLLQMQEWAGAWALAQPASRLGDKFWVAGLAAAPVLVPLGVVVPVLLSGARAIDRRGTAAWLFAAQGAGAFAGSLVFGHWLPALAGAAVFALSSGVAAAASVWGAALCLGWAHRAAGLVLVSVVVTAVPLLDGPGVSPLAGTRFDRPDELTLLAAEADAYGVATAAYDRRRHAMVLFTDEFRAAETGPGTGYMRVLGHLPMLLHREGPERVAVIALGTGTTANALAAWPGTKRIDVVELSPAVLALAPWFSGDGPLAGLRDDPQPAWSADPRTVVHPTDGRHWLAQQGQELDVITMEPLLPYEPGTSALYSQEFYRLAASRLRPGGVCVQWVPTHAMPTSMFETLLRTFASAFAGCSVWVVDQATLLVGFNEADTLPDAEVLGERLRAAPEAVRITLHRAGIAAADDFEMAVVEPRLRAEMVAGAPVLRDDRPFLEAVGAWSGIERLGFLGDNLEFLAAVIGDEPSARRLRLRGRIELARAAIPPVGNDVGDYAERPRRAVAALRAARARRPRSTLLHHEETRARRLEVERAIRTQSSRVAARLARAWLGRDTGSALVHLAASLDRDETERRRALEIAAAIDPTLWLREGRGERLAVPVALETFIAPPPGGRRPTSPLERLAVLDDETVVKSVRGTRGLAWQAAVAAAYPVACARVLARRRQTAPLAAGELRALRPLLDPAALELYASRAAAAQPAARELLDEVGFLWRTDLPMPSAIESLAAHEEARVRAGFAVQLSRRRGAASTRALAVLLRDPDIEVRRSAGVALQSTWPDRFQYDPDASEAERVAVAEALLRLHDLLK